MLVGAAAGGLHVHLRGAAAASPSRWRPAPGAAPGGDGTASEAVIDKV